MLCKPFPLLFVLLCTTANGQEPAIDWQRCVGGSDRDEIGRVLQDVEGHVICLGNTASSNGDLPGPGAGNYDAFLTSWANNSGLEAVKRFGGAGNDSGRDMVLSANGDIVVLGTRGSTTNVFDDDTWIFRVTPGGEVLWEHTYGGSSFDWPRRLLQLQNGDLLLVGSTFSEDGDITEPRGESDIWVLRLSSEGELIWQRTYGGSQDESACCAHEMTDGSIVIAGQTASTDGQVSANNGESDGWLLTLDAQGTLISERTYGGTGFDGFAGMARAGADEIVLIGSTSSTNGDVAGNHGGNDAWALKLNTSGDVLSQRCLGGSDGDVGKQLLVHPAGGYTVLAGSTSPPGSGDVGGNNGGYDFWLVRLNEDLEVVWENNYGGVGEETAIDLTLLSDGSYALVGFTMSNNTGDVSGYHGGFNDGWLVVTEPEPVAVYETTSDPFTVRLSASANELTIDYVLERAQRTSVTLFTAIGTCVAVQAGTPRGSGPQREVLSIAGLAPGVYQVALQVGESRYVRSFVRE